MGSDLLVGQLYSPIVWHSYTQHEYDMHGISKFLLIFSQINGGNIEIHTVESDKNRVSMYLIFIISQFYAKVLYNRAVGLSIRTGLCQVCTVQNNIENGPIGEWE